MRRGREVLAGFDTPTLVGPAGQVGQGRRDVASFRVSEETTRALGELARTCHTTVSTVLQGAFAQLLMSLTGQRDVAFGTTVSGRPDEVVGADSMVGLLINTVPVRATHHGGDHHHRPARPAAKRPQPDTGARALGAQRDPPCHRSGTAVRHRFRLRELSDRRRQIVGRRRIGRHRVRPTANTTITRLRSRPCRATNWAFASNIDTDVFDAAGIDTLMERFKRVLVAMTTDPTRPLSSMDVLDGG